MFTFNLAPFLLNKNTKILGVNRSADELVIVSLNAVSIESLSCMIACPDNHLCFLAFLMSSKYVLHSSATATPED